MDLDATQPLDTTILSAVARAVVPRALPTTRAPQVLVDPTPLGGPTRIRIREPALLAPDSQSEDTPLAPSAPPAWNSNAKKPDPDVPTPRHVGPDEDEQELLLIPKSAAKPQRPEAHSVAVEKALAAVSGVSNFTLDVHEGQLPEREKRKTSAALASPTLVGESSSTSSGQDERVPASTAPSIVDDVAVVHPSPSFHGDAPHRPFSIEPTLKVCEPLLPPASALPNASDEAYSPELRPTASTANGQRNLSPPQTESQQSKPAALVRTLSGQATLSPVQGIRASLAAARPTPIAQPEAQVDDPEFKTPDRVLRRMSQDDAPLVATTSTRTTRPGPEASITPSRRKIASPNAAKLNVGDYVEVKWGGSWYEGWVCGVPVDGLTVVIEWPDGTTETKARNMVRPARKTPPSRATADATTSATKRGRDSTDATKLERQPQPQPSAEASTNDSKSTRKVILSSTQLVEAMDEDFILSRRVDDSASNRPTTLLTPQEVPPWARMSEGDLSSFVVVTLTDESETLAHRLVGRGARVPTSIHDLIAALETTKRLGVVLVPGRLTSGPLSIDVDLLVPALEANPIAAAALGLGLTLVAAERWLSSLKHAEELSQFVLRYPNSHLCQHNGKALPVFRRVLSGYVIAVAAPPASTTRPEYPVAEILQASGATLIDAVEAPPNSSARPCGVYTSPSFQGQLLPELAHTLIIDLRFVLELLVGNRAWPASQLPHLNPTPTPPVRPSPPIMPREATVVPATLNINSTDSGVESSLVINPGDDYYAKAPGSTAEAILVRIEHRRSAEEVAVRIFRPQTEMRLVGSERRPMSVVELSPTLRTLPVRSLITDLPLFVLPASYLDHIYIIKGPEAPLETLGASSSAHTNMHTKHQRLRTPHAAEVVETSSPPRVQKPRDGSLEGASPVSKNLDRIEFLEPLAAASSYSSLDSSRSGQPGDRRYFRSAMVRGRVVEIGSLIQFEHDPPPPAIPKLNAPQPILLVGEVQQIYQDHNEGRFVVELRDDYNDMFPEGEVMVIAAEATVEVMLTA